VFDDIADVIEGAPSNWGKWGDDDELGAANYLTGEQVLRGIAAVEAGETYTLGLPIGAPDGDPTWPTRSEGAHYMTADKGHHEAGKQDREMYGGWEHSDDVVHQFTHGSTHVDSLGHSWYGDRLYNGFDANTTKGGLDRCGIEHPAEHGLVGRGVLLDVAAHRGVDYLSRGERVTLEELRACADEQGVDFEGREILLVRLGVVELFYREGPEAFYEEYETVHGGTPALDEPGITYTDDLAEWFADTEVPLFGTDSVTAEQTVSEATGTRLPLHPALLRDQGVLISEMNKLDDLAAACREDGSYEFMYVGAPLKLVGGTGSPFNPIAIR
jgi:kynurenine formamidase